MNDFINVEEQNLRNKLSKIEQKVNLSEEEKVK
ncbi:hypothetical protein Athe_0338 [Caldicellulosiruptor bescii DSM 6725]|uniref:Uncharacterized protein n=1 Tax=Caldicellulosiruptor bescii (strain ATCC BAA-1888 / DSM 6725 / KCTC 15123 / Z-1320) TaxID=521460 RepID=B9MN18_CALBD|nr:hypothetical protein Athe_0338 [Caldicellulosiruptor bescii DSM 6725]